MAKRIGAIGLAVVASIAASPALAAVSASDFKFDFNYTGPVGVKLEGVSEACVTELGNPNGCYGGNVVNADPGIAGPGGGTFNETTFGIGAVTEFRTDDGSAQTLWSPVSAGFEVAVFLYGVADRHIASAGGSNVTIYTEGCKGGDCDGKIHFDFYVMDDFGGFLQNTPAERTAFDTYAWKDGAGNPEPSELLMSLEFDPFGDATFPTSTLIQEVTDPFLPTATGDGRFYASCVAGPACTGINNVFLDTNSFSACGVVGGCDVFGQYTLDATPPGDWDGSLDDPLTTRNEVPAPSVLVLIGSGLLGLAGFRRRFRRSAE
jgi:hypothetical protein